MILGNRELSHCGCECDMTVKKIKAWYFCSSNRLFETFIRRNVADIACLLNPRVCNPRILIGAMVKLSYCPWAKLKTRK
jgi:hypothetical protein